MSDAPRVIWPTVFLDRFQYRGKSKLPGAETLPDEWEVVSGAFSTSDQKQLICTSPGILRYAGTSLDELVTGMTTPDFAWVIRFFGQEDLDFSLRVREDTDSNWYFAIRVNFTDNTITVTDRKLPPTTTSISYSLGTGDIDYYSVELWMLGEREYWVFVNGDPVFPVPAKTLTATDHTAYGFSIEVHNVPTGGAKFSKFAVHEIVSFPDLVPNNDGSDLYRLFRELIKEEIENPSTRNWTSFKKALSLWQHHRNVGKSDRSWEEDGLPIRRPSPGEFLQ